MAIQNENDTVSLFKISDKEKEEKADIVFGGSNNKVNIKDLSVLYGFELPEFPPKNYLKAIQTVLTNQSVSDVPWKYILPQNVFMEELKMVSKRLLDTLEGLDLSYYKNIFSKTIPLIEGLQPAKINKIAYKFFSTSKTKSNFIHTFQPDSNGYAKKPLYSKVSTKTGRLKVVSGPNILQIKKEERAVLESRFGLNGKIYMLDFKSLEPRIAWILAKLAFKHKPQKMSDLFSLKGPNDSLTTPTDLYSFLLDELDLRKRGVTRNLIKDIIISQLYGASSQTLYAQLNGKVSNVEEIVNLVSETFGMKTLKECLLEEFHNNSGKFISSYYGRRVNTFDAVPYTLINYFIQPTAVDVALLGFQKIFSSICEKNLKDKIVPIYVLHDALFLDVQKDYYEEVVHLKSEIENQIFGFESCNFPLEITNL